MRAWKPLKPGAAAPAVARLALERYARIWKVEIDADQ